MDANDVVITGVLTIIGTLLLEIIKRWLVRSKEKEDSNVTVRRELNDEIRKLREELRTADADLDKWKNENLELKSSLLRVKYDLAAALDLIRTRARMTDEQIDNEMKEIASRQ